MAAWLRKMKKQSKETKPRAATIEMDIEEVLSTSSTFVNASVPKVSADGRRILPHTTPVLPPSPNKRRRTDDEMENQLDDFVVLSEADGTFNVDEDLFLAHTDPNCPDSSKKKRYASSDDPLKEWLTVRSEYLAEIMRHEALGADSTVCATCGGGIKDCLPYRCKDCFFQLPVCQTCIVNDHRVQPLHNVERWNGKYFATSSLRDAGLIVQLGHPPNEACALPARFNDFVVLHTNGIHNLRVQICGCNQASLHGHARQQMLRWAWYPATFDQPQTCATFGLLKHFQMQTLQAKTTSYDYYSALEKLTDNTGLVKIPWKSRYKEFIRMHREYSHLLSLKRGGRAHAPSGISGTKRGELAVRCPACPNPLINLPPNWRSEIGNRFIYTLYIALDACFRLKRRIVSSADKDPGLGIDWSYFVENESFRKYLLTVTDQKEMSTCSGLAALDYTNTKFSRGYASTGVCLAICARHEIVQPNGVADLQVGERYANMDYCFASAMSHHSPLLRLLVSYDIACQWSKSVIERVKTLPPLIRLHLVSAWIRFAVPKLHIHSHTRHCQERYSLNYLPGVGQTDGEGVERPWANIGPMAMSTRVMGPGARVETLNAHWGHWNWQKVIGLGALLARRLRVALSERDIQVASFNIFSTNQAHQVEEWKKMVEDYEQDSTCPNPYEVPNEGISEQDVRTEYAKKDAEEAVQGSELPPRSSPFAFVSEGLDLLDQQHRIKDLLEDKTLTPSQEASLAEMRARLTKSLVHYRTLQAIYLPSAISVLQERSVPEDEEVESVPILLPSSQPPEGQSTCDARLLEIEQKLHEARCSTSLNVLRNLLIVKSRLLNYKDRHVRHQGPNTRARTLINRNEAKIKVQVRKYQGSWGSLKALASGEESRLAWPILLKTDVRCMSDPNTQDRRQVRPARASEHRRQDAITSVVDADDLVQPEDEVSDNGDAEEDAEEERTTVVARESRREVSWIWTHSSGVDSTEAIGQALRVEWAKSWARSRRWTEEVALLKEEMRRTLVSLRYDGQAWHTKATSPFTPASSSRTPSSLPIPEHAGCEAALRAYAHSQAQLRYDLADSFETLWRKGGKATEDDDLNEQPSDAPIVGDGEGNGVGVGVGDGAGC